MKTFDLIRYLRRQIKFSTNAFGPDFRWRGVVDHIRKELVEIEENPQDLEEWVDVATLALDGAWRAGHSPEQLAECMQHKLAKNEERDWPDWRTADPDKAIEHDRAKDAEHQCVGPQDACAQLAKIHPRTKKLIDDDTPFMVVKCSEPYANTVARLVKEQAIKDGTWTDECQEWMTANGIKLD